MCSFIYKSFLFFCFHSERTLAYVTLEMCVQMFVHTVRSLFQEQTHVIIHLQVFFFIFFILFVANVHTSVCTYFICFSFCYLCSVMLKECMYDNIQVRVFTDLLMTVKSQVSRPCLKMFGSNLMFVFTKIVIL